MSDPRGVPDEEPEFDDTEDDDAVDDENDEDKSST